MSGLPRVQDASRPRDVFAVMCLGGIEKLTESLRRGDAYDQQSLNEMITLRQRYSAFSHALDQRLAAVTERTE